MNPAIIYAVVCALIFGSGWQVRTWYDDAKDAAVLRAEQETRDKMVELAGHVATKTEEAIQGIKIENKVIYQTATREIISSPVYRDCVLPDTGRLHINAARGGAATGKPVDRLPAGATTGP